MKYLQSNVLFLKVQFKILYNNFILNKLLHFQHLCNVNFLVEKKKFLTYPNDYQLAVIAINRISSILLKYYIL